MADPSGVWCVQLQGGGGRQGGAPATDDNAADARAGPRDPGKIQTTPPRTASTAKGAPGVRRAPPSPWYRRSYSPSRVRTRSCPTASSSVGRRGPVSRPTSRW
ncbi:hypothetical protein FQ762_16960 [Streptomyces coelicolor A3(2)]|nr:hypothetical protein FQ762_16960 [Streptomyces coelicolor A3(2)]